MVGSALHDQRFLLVGAKIGELPQANKDDVAYNKADNRVERDRCQAKHNAISVLRRLVRPGSGTNIPATLALFQSGN